MYPEIGNTCPDSCGILPECAPLAVPYVPCQQTKSQRYGQMDALSNGTLYPGLNLPFRVKATATSVASSDMTELQALEFVIQELALYLDTHPGDSEAFELFRQYTELERATRADYVEKYGPLYREETAQCKTYVWNQGGFPWNAEMEG